MYRADIAVDQAGAVEGPEDRRDTTGASDVFDVVARARSHLADIRRPARDAVNVFHGEVHLGLVRDGDTIEIDIPGRTMNVKLSDEELAERRKGWEPLPPKINHGWLRRYTAMATSADQGAVLRVD